MKTAVLVLLISSLGFGQGFRLEGVVLSDSAQTEIPFADINIEALGKWQSTDNHGRFSFGNVPRGEIEIAVHRTGFRPFSRTVTIVSDTNLILTLTAFTETAAEVLVEGDKSHSELERPAQAIYGRKLRQNLAPTIAETIAGEAGISFRSMGSAPSRPVLRGLGGDRLLILEDNAGVGDMSATSADHAVAIDPLTANHIDVIRGPESFLFGSNTIGGVINVKRGSVPTDMPTELSGSAGSYAESVNNNLASSAQVLSPLGGAAAVRADVSYRKTDDTFSPDGRIKNTAIETTTAGVGASYFPSWGRFGSSFSYYKSDYGIPPDAEGGHASGVVIDMKRTQLKSELELPLSGVISSFQLKHNYNRYQHSEIESQGLTGQEFGVQSHRIDAVAALRGGKNFSKTKIHGSYFFRDYVAAGRANTPATEARTLSLAAYTEMVLSDHAGLNASLRIDQKSIEPFTRKETAAGLQRPRGFTGISGGLGGIYHFNKAHTLEANFVKTFRPPTLEELYSEGPHLAAYVFEIGNSSLGSEAGFGSELVYTFQKSAARFSASVFLNRFSDYITSKNTGEKSKKIASLFTHRFIGVDAQMFGFELTGSAELTHDFTLSGNLSYVEGENLEAKTSLPAMPPLSARLSGTYSRGAWSASATMNYAATQDKLDTFENLRPRRNSAGDLLVDENGLVLYTQKPTESYVTLDLSSEYSFLTGVSTLLSHTITLSVENVFNTTYRNHLNNIKLVFPEAGRNVKLLYKVFF